jgi:glucokinase
MVVDPAGPPCPCGLKGCLEQFASGGAIERMAREAVEAGEGELLLELAGSRDRITGATVSQAANRYDETALGILRRAGTSLGIGLSNAVNLFDPEIFVLGGSVVAAGEFYLGPLRDTLNAMVSAQRRRPVRLDLSILGFDAGIIGAAALAMDPQAAWEGTR